MQAQFTLLPFDDARFWSHVDFSGPAPEHCPELGACWLWTAARNRGGYGLFVRSGLRKNKNILAHRYAYSMTHGAIPPGLRVLHKCDVRACVNPAHHFTGTDADNITDMIAKNRHSHGEQHCEAKLTTENVREARRLYMAGGITQRELGERFNVAQTVMGRAIRRETWKHVTD